MELTKNELNNICKTLPIGYYIGRKLDVEVDDSIECSYFDPMKDEIKISLKQMNEAIDNIDCEEDARCMLYHEVSHAFLTPMRMEVNRQRNIVEDERIETILANYYMNTNFKRFVKKVNHFKGEKPANREQAFYYLVRYRIGEKKWLERLEKLIYDYKGLTRNSGKYNAECYEYEIDKFYKEFMVEEENKEEKKEINPIESSVAVAEPAEETFSKDFANTLIKNIVNQFENQTIDSKFNEILSKITFRTKTNGTAINSYSGTFDPRQVIRDDYKYFVQKNRNGHVKANSKFNLNLFIDVSGSFSRSETIVNSMLKSLLRFEKKNLDFSFSLITCEIGQQIKPKNERKIKCYGGNYVTKEIFEQVKAVQRTDATNYNIVMFDGYAMGDGPYKDHKNFAAFNKSNFTIISDDSNEFMIDEYCKSAKKIITKHYAEELIDNVIKTLQIAAR